MVLHEVDLICHLWQHYVNMALLPLASSSVTVRREMVVFNNQSVSRIEGAANHVMQRLADGRVINCHRVPRFMLFLSSNHYMAGCSARKAEEERFQAKKR